MSAPVIAGAEPYSASGDNRGALVLHGFTGNPQSMRGLAVALADAGFTVEMPLLPGHGTAVEDMLDTRWKDWSHAAEQAYADLAARTDSVVVVGLSMGGTLSVWLAEHHPEIAALSLVNPLLVPPDDGHPRRSLQAMIDAGDEVAPGIGSDIALEGAVESAYPGMPLRAALSLFEGVAEVEALLDRVALSGAPLHEHAGPRRRPRARARAWWSRPRVRSTRSSWTRSYHVATLDYDKDEIETRTVDVPLGRARAAGMSEGAGPAPLSREDVMHVAGLARLELSEDGGRALHGAAAHRARARTRRGRPRPLPPRALLPPDRPAQRAARRTSLARAWTGPRCSPWPPAVEDDRFRVPRIGGEAP